MRLTIGFGHFLFAIVGTQDPLSGGVARSAGVGHSIPYNPPQGLTALSPPKRGIGCHFLSHTSFRFVEALHDKTPRVQNTARIVLLSNLLHQGSVLEVISPDVDSGFQ